MEAQAPALPRMTVEEFFAFVETQEQKYEFHDGEVLAMSGGLPKHARLEDRLASMLDRGLRGSECRSFGASLHLSVKAAGSYVHPDKSIVCGPLDLDPAVPNGRGVLNARVVFEILSDSTEGYDRGGKFNLYQQVPTLEEYLLISQHQPEVQSFLRQPDSTWNLAFFRGLDAVAKVRCLPLEIPLAELYEE